MTREQLGSVLWNTALFESRDVEKIVGYCGSFTIGAAITVCFLFEKELGIELMANDVNVMIETANERLAQ